MKENSVIKNSNASKVERGLAFGGIALAFGALGFVKFVNPTSTSIFPACPLHSLTGLNCPGCGATRGMHALLNGDVLTALHFNAMLVIFVPIMIYIVLTLASIALRGRSFRMPRSAPIFLFAVLFLLIAFGVLRNLPFYPFNLLAI